MDTLEWKPVTEIQELAKLMTSTAEAMKDAATAFTQKARGVGRQPDSSPAAAPPKEPPQPSKSPATPTDGFASARDPINMVSQCIGEVVIAGLLCMVFFVLFGKAIEYIMDYRNAGRFGKKERELRAKETALEEKERGLSFREQLLENKEQLLDKCRVISDWVRLRGSVVDIDCEGDVESW